MGDGPQGDGTNANAAAVAATAASTSRSGKVLVVDDEEPVLRTVSMLLSSAGYEVIGARSGAEALERLEDGREPIRCVMLDVTMPKMSGVECLRLIRQRWPDLPVVLTSGYTAQDVDSAISGDPHTAFLQKPYRLASLCDKLAELTPGLLSP